MVKLNTVASIALTGLALGVLSSQVATNGQPPMDATLEARVVSLELTVLKLEERIARLEQQPTSATNPAPASHAERHVAGALAPNDTGSMEVFGDEVYKLIGQRGRYVGGMEGHWIKRNIARGLFILEHVP